MKVTTKDFQALQGDNTFEFPVGITIVQGRTGSGKTSLFYAIEDCLSNPAGVDDVIHWDAKTAQVTVENNDSKITWIKTATSSEYVDESTGQHYPKASKIDSRNLGDLGFYFNKDNDVVNIHSEWKKLFPFELKDTEMFRLFEDIFNISSSFNIIDSYKKDEQELKSQINQINKNINETTQTNNCIEDILNKVDSTTIQEHIDKLTTTQNVISQMLEDYNNLSRFYPLTHTTIPAEFDTTSLINKSAYCDQLQHDYNKYQVNHKLLEIELPQEQQFNIEPNIYIKDYNEYNNLYQQIAQYNQQLQDLQNQETVLNEQLKQIKVCPTCGHSLED